jgi:glycosyltransferase involved in cell wall biosynthesis
VRIAQVMAGAPEGGAELFFERLSIALHQHGDDILPVVRNDPARAARLRHAGLSPIQLNFGGPFDLRTGWRLRRVLRTFAPRVVIAWMNRAANFTPRGDYVLAGRLGGYYDLKYYRRCDHLIGNTSALAAWIVAQGFPPARTHYLPNFVPDLAEIPPASRAEFAIPAGAPVLLGLGRLHPNKGFDIFIRALAKLPGAHAVIAGEGPERAALAALARAEGVADRVHLPGWRQDVGALLAMADIFVSSSRHEPLGNMVIEAFSAARPVIAAAADGPRELIGADTGILVPVDDPAALAEAVQSLRDDPARQKTLAEAGRAHYLSAYAEAPVLALWRDALGRMEKTCPMERD